MEALLADLRYAVRSLRHSPGFSAIAILTLALGIGATTAIASLLYGVLLRPLPYANPEQLVQVTWGFEQGWTDALTASEYVYWREHARSFAAASAYAGEGAGFNLETGDAAQYVRGQLVADSLFAVLGVRPTLGRDFSAEETRAGGPPVAIVSYGLWRDRFGADRRIVGRAVRVNGVSYMIVGVMPQGFQFGGIAPDLFLPLVLRLDPRDQGHNTNMIARLSPGVSLGAAQGDMARLLAEFRRDVPGHAGQRERGARLVPYRELLVAGVRPTLVLLFGAVALVVLIAIANATGLLFGRASARAQEIAVRTALGAGRWALARPLLAEGLVLALAGGVGGVLLAHWTLDLVAAASPGNLAQVAAVRLDLPVLAAAFALSLAAGLAVGVVPALKAGRDDLRGSLQAGDRGLGGVRQRARAILVGTEIALSVVLVAGALLLIVSLSSLWSVNPGFDPSRLWVVQLSLPSEKYGTTQSATLFEEAVRERLAALPGVSTVATASSPPFERGLNTWVNGVKDGRPLQAYVESRLVSPGYFETLGIPVLRGRSLTRGDAHGTAPVVVVSAALARTYWPDSAAVGHTLDGAEVVGVVGDVRTFGCDQAAPPM